METPIWLNNNPHLIDGVWKFVDIISMDMDGYGMLSTSNFYGYVEQWW